MQERLFHISEEPNITKFAPLPSLQYPSIDKNVVFAISGKMLHNYILPRDCPRVTYYRRYNSSKEDVKEFFGDSKADYIINVESDWALKIQQTTLYCYESPTEAFTLLDECAGYYISYDEIIPTSIFVITDIVNELNNRNVELRFLPSLLNLADKVAKSSLNFSIIRMRNAKRITKGD